MPFGTWIERRFFARKLLDRWRQADNRIELHGLDVYQPFGAEDLRARQEPS